MNPTQLSSRPAAREVNIKLMALIENMASSMLENGYDTDQVEALAAIVAATARHSEAGLAVRAYLTGQRQEDGADRG